MLFTRRFFILFAIGALPLFILWSSYGARSNLKWGLIAYDLALLVAAFVDYRRTEHASQFEVNRQMPRRFMIGEENEVRLQISIHGKGQAPRNFTLQVKDEYPPDLELRGERLLVASTQKSGKTKRRASVGYKLYAASRGDYGFGDIVMRWQGPWGLVVKQLRIPAAESVKVYPNINEARRHELAARRNRLVE